MGIADSTPATAQLIVAVSRALEFYDRGKLVRALDVLRDMEPHTRPDHPALLAAELERRRDMVRRGIPVPDAALDWIEEARLRIRRELGEDIPEAVTPAGLALRSALTCLGG